MMNLVDILARAEQRQQAVHQNRSFHREQQKACEREDQSLKLILRTSKELLLAQAKFAEVLHEAPPELLSLIGAAEAQPITPAPVLDDAASRVVAGEVDHREEGPAAEPPAEAGPVHHDPDADDRAAEDEPAAGDAVSAVPAVAESSGNRGDAPAEEEAQAYRVRQQEYDRAFLDRMRQEAKEGICPLKVQAIAVLAGLDKRLAPPSIKRLKDAGKIVPVPRLSSTDFQRYRVADFGASFPVGAKPAPRVAPPASATVLISRTAKLQDLAARMLDLFRKVEGNGHALFAVQTLVERLGADEYHVDEALTLLAESGEIIRVASGLKGHVTVRLLKMPEAAE